MIKFLQKNYKFFILTIILAIITISPLRNYIQIEKWLGTLNTIKDTSYAPILYILLYIVGVVLALPGFALTILAGPLFGFSLGTILVIIGSNVGCQLTFFISRLLGKDFVKRYIKADSYFEKLSKKIEDNGFLVMLYLRLLPIFPFNGVNYISGLSQVKYWHYTLATFVGMLPATLVYVYLSTSVADVKNNPMGVIISIVVLILFTGVIMVLKRKRITRHKILIESTTEKSDIII
ncbi:TVP38/TMEM64 family protein [Petrocella sp. FN5]|uniref:TVP38/TMEM64 family protein n=1 Tax=Petrocella sp. FN5 TaxID=3032002 RepID=UPI0023DCE368|nr:TVP38/TMEM64 family protein [Petrocella sp. FN5]MDF1618417.1 TVP38/TMEM64 family protein [Petrocella sp. FN5]